MEQGSAGDRSSGTAARGGRDRGQGDDDRGGVGGEGSGDPSSRGEGGGEDGVRGRGGQARRTRARSAAGSRSSDGRSYIARSCVAQRATTASVEEITGSDHERLVGGSTVGEGSTFVGRDRQR